MCRASGCYLSHSAHYCEICKDINSTHKSQQCPQGVTVYHGTYAKNVESITLNGFRISQKGRIGPGVYFADQFQVAKSIAINRWKSPENGKKVNQSRRFQPCVVLQCRISKYRTLDIHPGKIWTAFAVASAPMLFFGPVGWLAYGVYNTVTGIAFSTIGDVKSGNHPQWAGVVNHTFKEYAVQKQDVKSIRVLRIHKV